MKNKFKMVVSVTLEGETNDLNSILNHIQQNPIDYYSTVIGINEKYSIRSVQKEQKILSFEAIN